MNIKLRSRRVQLLSNSLYVSLPVEYVRSIGLDKGDLVDISLNSEGVLSITKNGEVKNET